MEQILKEVVNVQKFYIVDGIEFSNYGAALNYEFEWLVKNKDLVCKTRWGDDVSYTEAEIVCFRTKEALHSFIEISHHYDYSTDGLSLNSPLGIYIWEGSKWLSPQDIVELYKYKICAQLEQCGLAVLDEENNWKVCGEEF